jgi:hypothetical protein
MHAQYVSRCDSRTRYANTPAPLQYLYVQVIVILYQNAAFPTVQGSWGTIAPHLLVPEPTSFASFFVCDSFHQPGVATANARK